MEEWRNTISVGGRISKTVMTEPGRGPRWARYKNIEGTILSIRVVRDDFWEVDDRFARVQWEEGRATEVNLTTNLKLKFVSDGAAQSRQLDDALFPSSFTRGEVSKEASL